MSVFSEHLKSTHRQFTWEDFIVDTYPEYDICSWVVLTCPTGEDCEVSQGERSSSERPQFTLAELRRIAEDHLQKHRGA